MITDPPFTLVIIWWLAISFTELLALWGKGIYLYVLCAQCTKWPKHRSRKKRVPGLGGGKPVQYSCLENPMDGGAWWAAVNGVAKSQTQLSDFTFTFHFHALEKEMATHSSVLAWRIPGTGVTLVGCRPWGHRDWTRLKRLCSSSKATYTEGCLKQWCS